ncbi:MAG: hypothetical protein AAGK79_13305 [Pseudomonadota bacterium]
MDTDALLNAGRAPRHLFPWGKGKSFNATVQQGTAFMTHVCLHGLQFVDFPMEGYGGYTVMDDSDQELSRHFDAVRHATGSVLKTGLGFGCFVRMCLTKPDVEHIDVVEINGQIIDHFGAEFADDPRVTIHHADAFEFDPTGRSWNFGWHDIYTDGNEGLASAHIRLIKRYLNHCKKQGAWQLPRETRNMVQRKWPGLLI